MINRSELYLNLTPEQTQLAEKPFIAATLDEAIHHHSYHENQSNCRNISLYTNENEHLIEVKIADSISISVTGNGPCTDIQNCMQDNQKTVDITIEQNITYTGETFKLLLFLALVCLAHDHDCILSTNSTEFQCLYSNFLNNLVDFIADHSFELDISNSSVKKKFRAIDKYATPLHKLKLNIYNALNKASTDHCIECDYKFFTACLKKVDAKLGLFHATYESLPKSPDEPGVLSPTFVKSKFIS